MLNTKYILNLTGMLLLLEGIFMLVPIGISLIYHESDIHYFLESVGITFLVGLVLWLVTKNCSKDVSRRDAYLVVSMTWVVFSLFGALPYYLGHFTSSYTDAFFEAISGFTTTGASVFNEVEHLPHGLLFWRSMTHLLGGMGILVLSIAILPFLGFGSTQLFNVEASGPELVKLHPRVKNVARSLWGIYMLLVVLETLLLWLGDMNLFDAVCHSFATVATGGFSTKNASLGAFSPYSQYVVIVFMILSGISFLLHFKILHGNYKAVLQNSELKLYLIFILVFGSVITGSLVFLQKLNFELAFREGFFQVASILSCTGFANTDYMTWTHHLWFILFILMFIGGNSGSTSGGIKVARYVIFFENLKVQYKRLLHPQAIVHVHVKGMKINNDVISRTFVFFILYFLIFFLGSVFMHFIGLTMPSSVGAVATTMGGIGPGFGSVGPSLSFHSVPDSGKWVLSFLMLLGRLELFAVLILFSKVFWRNE